MLPRLCGGATLLLLLPSSLLLGTSSSEAESSSRLSPARGGEFKEEPDDPSAEKDAALLLRIPPSPRLSPARGAIGDETLGALLVSLPPCRVCATLRLLRSTLRPVAVSDCCCREEEEESVEENCDDV